MLPTGMPRGLMQDYYNEITDSSYRPRVTQYPVRAQTTPYQLDTSTEPAVLKIDAAACYRDMDLYINPTEFTRYISSQYQQAYYENLRGIASDGYYLAAIEKGHSVAQLAASHAVDSAPFRIDLKVKSPPSITYQPAQVDSQFTPGDVTMVPTQQGVGLNILV